jgi:CoA:oxalate CoA-transferase
MTALAARELTGKGTTVDVAMLDATFALLEHGLMDALGLRERPHRLGNRHPFMYPFDTFACKDQPLAITVGNDHLFGLLVQTLGKPDLATDDRFKSNEQRSDNWKPLKAEMEAVLGTDTAATWRERLEAAGVPVGIVLNVSDTRDLPQIKARGMVKDINGYTVPGSPMKYGAWNSLGTEIPSPALDQNGDALRAEFAAGAE